jgi:hypothetical protein
MADKSVEQIRAERDRRGQANAERVHALAKAEAKQRGRG